MNGNDIHKVVNIFHVLTGVLCSAICPQSVENCVCVLHNLTYQLETEVPTVFSKFNTLASENRANTGDTGPIGCFSNQSRKLQQEVSIHLKVHLSIGIQDKTADKRVQLIFFTVTLQLPISSKLLILSILVCFRHL